MRKPYTLTFNKVGKPDKNGYYKVYVKYYYKDNGKYINKFIPTTESLTDSEIKQLKDNTLRDSAIKESLVDQFNQINEIVEIKFYSLGRPPSIEEVTKVIAEANNTHKDNVIDLELHIEKYISQLEVKSSSKKSYEYMLNDFKEKLESSDLKDFKYKDQVINNSTLYYYEHELKKSNDQTIVTIKNKMFAASKLIEYLAQIYEIELPYFKFKYDTRKKKKEENSRKLHFTDEETEKLLLAETDNEHYIWVQDILKLNFQIGLRISEIFSIYKKGVEIVKTDKHNSIGYILSLNIFDKKKTEFRTVYVIDEIPIKLIEKNLNKPQKYIFLKSENSSKTFDQHLNNFDKVEFDQYIRSLTKLFNDYLKKFCEELGGTFKDDFVYLYNGNTLIKPRHEKVSSHAIRRYSASSKLRKGVNIKLIQALGGWSSPSTIYNNYDRELKNDEILDLLAIHKDD